MKSQAQIRATAKYDSKTYYKPTVLIRREYQEMLHKKAEEKKMSVSSYIWDLIKKDLGIEE